MAIPALPKNKTPSKILNKFFIFPPFVFVSIGSH